MNNYKIKVNNESESKEAQELFFELGYGFDGGLNRVVLKLEYNGEHYFFAYKDDLDLTHTIDKCIFNNKLSHKEITLHELRTLVALKKNPNVEPVITGIGLADSVKHWEKVREMKEYINKTTGEYRKTAGKVTGEQWVEVPDGADMYVRLGNEEYPHFRKTINGENYLYCFDKTWKHSFFNLEDATLILWQRYTQPEPLPFIDDEPKQKPISITIDPNTPRSAVEINEAAMQHIVERGKTYDSRSGERSANKTAQAFNAITGKSLSESDVWLLLSLLKMVRQESKADYHKDSAEDLIAYTSLYAESLESLA